MPSSQVVSCDFTLNDSGIVGLLQRSVGERIAATVLASSLTHLHLLQCGAQGRCLNAIVHNCRSLKTLEIDPINNAQMEDFSPDFSPYSVYDPAALAALGDMNDLNGCKQNGNQTHQMGSSTDANMISRLLGS